MKSLRLYNLRRGICLATAIAGAAFDAPGRRAGIVDYGISTSSGFYDAMRGNCHRAVSWVAHVNIGEGCSMVWRPLLSRHRVALGALLVLALLSASAGAQQAAPLVRSFGETIYVPTFSHILKGKRQKQPMASTLVVHNVDPERSIKLTGVRYHDHEGRLVEEFVKGAIDVGPLATKSFLVGIREDRGGVGANFIVEWSADQATLSPVTEAVMIGGTGTQGLSFISTGKVIVRRLAREE